MARKDPDKKCQSTIKVDGRKVQCWLAQGHSGKHEAHPPNTESLVQWR